MKMKMKIEDNLENNYWRKEKESIKWRRKLVIVFFEITYPVVWDLGAFAFDSTRIVPHGHPSSGTQTRANSMALPQSALNVHGLCAALGRANTAISELIKELQGPSACNDDAMVQAANTLQSLTTSARCEQGADDTESDDDTPDSAEAGPVTALPVQPLFQGPPLPQVARQAFVETRSSTKRKADVPTDRLVAGRVSKPHTKPAHAAGCDVGRRVHVFWVPPGNVKRHVRMRDLQPYTGTVVQHRLRGGPRGQFTHLVHYDDGTRRWHNIHEERGLFHLAASTDDAAAVRT